MELGAIIARKRKQANMTIDELALRSGVPKGTLNKIINGVTKDPQLETVKSIARALNCTLDDFDDAPRPRRLSSAEDDFMHKYRKLDSHGKAALQAILNVEYARCSEPTPKNVIDFPAESGADCIRYADFGIRVSGDSMEPRYHDGDILMVQKTETLELGEIGVVIMNGEGYVKQIGPGQLISLNPKYGPIPLNESVFITGRVIGVLPYTLDELDPIVSAN